MGAAFGVEVWFLGWGLRGGGAGALFCGWDDGRGGRAAGCGRGEEG